MAADVTGLITALADQVTPICDAAAEALGRDIQATAPVGETGQLSTDWDVTTDGGGTGATSTLKFLADYASFQDDPQADRIFGNPLLSFVWHGQQVIVHSVSVNPVNRGWFTDKATDDGLWSLLVQAELDSSVIS